MQFGYGLGVFWFWEKRFRLFRFPVPVRFLSHPEIIIGYRHVIPNSGPEPHPNPRSPLGKSAGASVINHGKSVARFVMRCSTRLQIPT